MERVRISKGPHSGHVYTRIGILIKLCVTSRSVFKRKTCVARRIVLMRVFDYTTVLIISGSKHPYPHFPFLLNGTFYTIQFDLYLF